ncbi:MAG TPA: glycosyltransferase [Thermoanaerobaculia bacterium]|nr:glycosyltransferase [Thermoanaerobaculia bacterium]
MLLEGGPAHPSGVVRALIYRDHLARNGYDAIFRSRRSAFLFKLVLQPPRWLAPLTAKGPGRLILYGIMEVLARLNEPLLLAAAKRCDIVYSSKLQSYRFVKKLRESTKAKLVFDFGDALWLYSRAKGFAESLALAHEVTTDNVHTAEFVRTVNPNCTVIPDAPQVELFDARRAALRRKSDGSRIVIGWIGTPTAAYNLYRIWPVLERLFIKYPQLHLRLVGTGEDRRFLPPFERIRYSLRPTYDQAGMIEEVLGFDIGVFPQFDTEKDRVRGVLKASVYMAGEAAVVASAIGQSREFIRDGVNGMLAATDEEWEQKISALIEDAELRGRLASEALRQVRAELSTDAMFAKLDAVFRRQLGAA